MMADIANIPLYPHSKEKKQELCSLWGPPNFVSSGDNPVAGPGHLIWVDDDNNGEPKAAMSVTH